MTIKNRLLSEFKKCSSSELSFLRRTASLTLLDALCHLMKTDAKSLFNSNDRDWISLLQLHRSNQVVVTFMLHNDIDPKNDEFSEKDKETIGWCLMELTKHLKNPSQKEQTTQPEVALTKKEVIKLVDGTAELVFAHWYKNELHYKNGTHLVVLRPDYRDNCNASETLESLLSCEDYDSVGVYIDSDSRPLVELFSKKGDNV